MYEMYDNLGGTYETHLNLLRILCLNKFKADQRGVQTTSNICNVVMGLVDNCVFAFKSGARRLRFKGSWRLGSKSNSALLKSFSSPSMEGGGNSDSVSRNGASSSWKFYGGTSLDLSRELEKSANRLLTMARESRRF